MGSPGLNSFKKVIGFSKIGMKAKTDGKALGIKKRCVTHLKGVISRSINEMTRLEREIEESTKC